MKEKNSVKNLHKSNSSKAGDVRRSSQDLPMQLEWTIEFYPSILDIRCAIVNLIFWYIFVMTSCNKSTLIGHPQRDKSDQPTHDDRRKFVVRRSLWWSNSRWHQEESQWTIVGAITLQIARSIANFSIITIPGLFHSSRPRTKCSQFDQVSNLVNWLQLWRAYKFACFDLPRIDRDYGGFYW